MSWGKFFVCLLIAGAMAYGGYLIDLPRTVYIAISAGIFITAVTTSMK